MRRGLSLTLLALLTAVSAVLAFYMKDEIHQKIVVPLAFLWWVVGLYYHLVPQIIFWILLLIFGLFTAVKSLLPEFPRRLDSGIVRRSSHGPIEKLSVLLQKRKIGMYYKWLIAHRLGQAAREILDQREGRLIVRRYGRLAGRDWNPPEAIDQYLESGLNSSFADYPRRGWRRSNPTPLDVQPHEVVDFLETEMELHRNGNR